MSSQSRRGIAPWDRNQLGIWERDSTSVSEVECVIEMGRYEIGTHGVARLETSFAICIVYSQHGKRTQIGGRQ